MLGTKMIWFTAKSYSLSLIVCKWWICITLLTRRDKHLVASIYRLCAIHYQEGHCLPLLVPWKSCRRRHWQCMAWQYMTPRATNPKTTSLQWYVSTNLTLFCVWVLTSYHRYPAWDNIGFPLDPTSPLLTCGLHWQLLYGMWLGWQGH